jgi:hypothetical protein
VINPLVGAAAPPAMGVVGMRRPQFYVDITTVRRTMGMALLGATDVIVTVSPQARATTTRRW